MMQLNVVISGDVQGVGFRYAAHQLARSLNLCGWVRNDNDGTVRCLASGSKDKLERFLSWLHRGPPGANVTGVQYDYKESTEILPHFTIR